MTVRDLLHRVDSAELSEWIAFLDLEREQQPASPPPAADSIDIKSAWRAHLQGKRNG